MRNMVTVEDAVNAINLMKKSLQEMGIDPETDVVDIDAIDIQ
jgi:DNA replicative helicase MCM subunit Mcm2 (Cdc46/Mcm family)